MGDTFLTIQLDVRIYQEICRQAEEFGISNEELVRYKLGQEFGIRSYRASVSGPSAFPPGLPKIGPPSDEMMDNLANTMINMVIASETVKCAHCLKPLDRDELIMGICSCGTKIGKNEPDNQE